MHAVRRAGIGLVALCALLGGRGPVGAQQTNGGAFVPLRADGNGVAALRRPVTLRHDATPLGDVLRGIMRAADLELVFRADLPDLERAITVHREDITAAAALLRVLEGTRLRVLVSATGQAVLVEAGAARARFAGGVVSGAVREAGGAPVGFAEIELRGTGRSVAADAAGRFRVRDVPPGEYDVVARRVGYHAASVAGVHVQAGGETVVDLALEAAPTPLAAVIVTPGHFGMLEQSVASRQSLSREEIETKPQIGDDIFRAVNRIPGVTSQDMSAAFGVRGGAHRELFVRLDGLELIEPFHLKDIQSAISIVDLGSIGGVDLITGGFGAEYGNRLTGVFDMRTTAVAPGRARTSLGVSLTNLRAGTQGAFANDRGRWLFTARRGYLDLALELGNGDTSLSPRYYDVLGKVEYELSPRALLSAHLLHAGDRLSYDDDDPREPILESAYTSSYAWVNLDASPAEGLSALTVLSVGRLDWERVGDRVRDPRRFGGLAVEDRRWFEFAGLRQDWTYELSDGWLMKAGLDAKSASADYDYFGWHEDFLVSNGQVIARLDTVHASAAPAGTTLGAYVSQRVRPWRPLTLELGAEWSRQSYTDEDHVNPRVNLALSAGRTTLRGAWGRYAQAQGLHELQVQDGVDRFFPAEHAEHRVLSVEHGLPSGVELRAELYERRTDDLRPRFINLDNTDDSFPEATPSRSRVDPDEGRARGLELLARKRGGRFDWTASYARASVTERFGAVWERAQRDQRHTVGLDLTYSPDPRWRFAAAWTWHTGWPYTPPVVRADSIADGGWFFSRDYPEYNSARLPAYHRMDVRVSRLFETRRGRVSVFLDVWNLYDRMNARGVFTNVTGIRNGEPITAKAIDGLIPRLPSFGIFWEF